MRNQIYRFLPIVLGLFVGWLLFNPPDWFRALGALGWLVNFAICGLLVLTMVPLVALASLPEELKTRPIPLQQLPQQLIEIGNQLGQLGFRRIEPPLEVQIAPPARLIGFVHEREPVYATVYRTTTVPAKTNFDFVSILDGDRGGLTTSGEPAGAALPASAGEFRQVLAGEPIDRMFAAHLEGLSFLRAKGVAVRALTAEAFARDLGLAIRHQRQTFLSAPLRSSLITFWRGATKRVPFVGRLAEQPVVVRQLECLMMGRRSRAF